jgi:hypothetical protein
MHSSAGLSRRAALQSGLWLAAAGAFATLASLGIIESPRITLGGTLAVLAVAAAVILPTRVVVAGFLFYLPFEAWIVGLLPGSIASVARYGPEALGAVMLVAALASTSVEWHRWRDLMGALTAVAVVWGIGAVHAGVSPSTAVIGYRSELRWVPLAFVVALTRDHVTDTRWYGRAVVVAAAVQSVIAMLEWIGGSSVSAFFSPNYAIVIGGLSVASASAHVHSIFGTFENHNAFATYLVFAWVSLVAIGWSRLGIRRDVHIVLAVLIPFVIVITGSREAALALVLGGLVVGRVRLRLPSVRLALLLGVAVVALGTAYTTTTTLDKDTRGQLGTRWAVIFNPATYSTTDGQNFRLSLLFQEVGLTARHSPLLGYGIGSVVDPRSVPDGSNPLYRIPAGLEAIQFRYIFDGNWGLLAVETGFLGVAAVIVLLAAIGRIGVRAAREPAGVVVYCLVGCVVLLGFFECVLQDAPSTLVWWVFVGLAIAGARCPAPGE